MCIWNLQLRELFSIYTHADAIASRHKKMRNKKNSAAGELHACVICILVRLRLRWQNSLLQSCDSCVILCVPLQSLARRAYVIFIVGYFCRLMVADMSRVKQIRNSIYCWDTRVNQQGIQQKKKKMDRQTHPNMQSVRHKENTHRTNREED